MRPSTAPTLRLAALLLTASASAQPAEDWRTLEPAAGLALPLSDGFALWEAGPGGALRLEAPAYGGHARLALRIAAYAPERDGLPSFVAAFPTLGWGPALRLPGGAALRAGPHVGAVHLRFEAAEGFGGNLQNETELAVGAWARLEAPVAGRLRAWAEAEVLRAALADPATLATASAGLAVRLDTPRWLRSVLR
jgi:hypothetical protein